MEQHTDTEHGNPAPLTQGLVPGLAMLALLGLSAWAAFALIKTVATAMGPAFSGPLVPGL